MFSHLDLSSVFLTAGFMSIALLLCMIVIARERETYAGFTQWAIATLALGLGMGLIGLRDSAPPFLTIIVANVSILSSLIMVHDGLMVFMGITPRRWYYAIPLILLLVPYTYLTYVHPNVRVRIVISSSLLAAYATVILAFDLREVMPIYRRNWLLPVGFGLLILLYIGRIAHDAQLPAYLADFMSTGSSEAIFIIGSFSTSILIIMGLVVLNIQRTQEDLKRAMAEVKTLRGIVPICASCKKIRDDDGYWKAVDSYVQAHTEAEFSHGLCPECTQKLYPEIAAKNAGGNTTTQT